MSRVAHNLESGSVERFKEKVDDLGKDLREVAGAARDVGYQQVDRVREHARQMEKTLEDYIREQPLKSLLVAAGVGVVLGYMWRR